MYRKWAIIVIEISRSVCCSSVGNVIDKSISLLYRMTITCAYTNSCTIAVPHLHLSAVSESKSPRRLGSGLNTKARYIRKSSLGRSRLICQSPLTCAGL